MKISHLISLVALCAVVSFWFFTTNQTDNEKKGASPTFALIEEVRVIERKAQEDRDTSLYTTCKERLDKAIKEIPEDEELYREVYEERYLHLPMTAISTYLVLNELTLAKESIEEVAYYLKFYEDDPRYAPFHKQLAEQKRSFATMSQFVERTNQEIKDYLKLWLSNYRSLEGHYPEDEAEFKKFLDDYSIDYPESYTFTKYEFYFDRCLISYYDAAVGRDYDLEISFDE